MTLKEALQKGYTLGQTSWQRGYISRKTDVNSQEVMYGGRKHDMPYVLVPSFKSSSYCVRQYLNPPIKKA